MKDWVAWHWAYEDPSSPLSRRLEVVAARLREALQRVGPGATVLSLCAGEGRDVLAVCRQPDMPRPARAVLVELDPTLARRAAAAAAAADGSAFVEVRQGDAADVSVFDDVLPVGVLLACGIFGNVAHGALPTIIAGLMTLLAPGGVVIWTRGASEPDHRAEVRAMFRAAGLDELSFDGAPASHGVGVNLLPADSRPGPPLPTGPLFTFVR